MKQILIAFLLLLFAFGSNAQQKAEILTNETIIELTKNKLPESVIIQKIIQADCNFDISTNALIKLKNSNVADNVLDEMVKKQNEQDKIKNEKNNESIVEYRLTSDNENATFLVYYSEEHGYIPVLKEQSGWTYTFSTNKKPFTATLKATLLSTNTNKPFKNKVKVTLSILVNNNIVATKTDVIGFNSATMKNFQIQYIIK